jgi:hypothetical protein
VQNNLVSAKDSASDSSFKSLPWIKLAAFGGLALLVGAGIYMTSNLGRALQFHPAGTEATVRTADGDWRVERPSEEGPGLPVYPEASLVLGSRGGVPAGPKHNQSEVYTTIYHSSDPSEFVNDWYLKHLGPEFAPNSSTDRQIPRILLDASITDKDITFVGERGDQVRIVAIATDSTGTEIKLVRSTIHEGQ